MIPKIDMNNIQSNMFCVWFSHLFFMKNTRQNVDSEDYTRN